MNCGTGRVYFSSSFAPTAGFASGGRLQVVNGVLMVLSPDGEWVPATGAQPVEIAPLSGEMRVFLSGALPPDTSHQSGAAHVYLSGFITPNPPAPEALDRVYAEIEEQ